jgi:cystathionine beta-lyase
MTIKEIQKSLKKRQPKQKPAAKPTGAAAVAGIDPPRAERSTAGADALAINPVHALFPGHGKGHSPYSPSSRLFLNGTLADPALDDEFLKAAKARGITTALDNTWGAGIALRGFEHGIDIVMQALTKFPSGGGDVLMGSVVTRDAALHERIKLTHMRLGLGVAGNDAELVLRSLATMPLRYAAQDAAGRALATWLGQRPEVAQVLHPALPGSPGHEHWQRHCTAAAGLFSVMLHERYSAQQVEAFVDALQLFRIGYSWAGPVSLVVPYELAGMRSAAAAQQPHLRGHLVRFSMGLEAVADLQADLAQALESALR